jgi:hypothetical protein
MRMIGSRATSATWRGFGRLRATSRWVVVAGIVACLPSGGCGPAGNAVGPPLHPVSGTVKLNGQPVAGADVVFQLKEDSRSSFGRTDANGQYSLTTRTGSDGAPEGDYVVAISKVETPAEDPSKFIPQEDKRYNPFAGKSVAATPPKSTLPSKYGDAKTSGLTARVNAGKNTLDFDLK